MAERRLIDAADLELAHRRQTICPTSICAPPGCAPSGRSIQAALARSNNTLSVAARLLGRQPSDAVWPDGGARDRSRTRQDRRCGRGNRRRRSIGSSHPGRPKPTTQWIAIEVEASCGTGLLAGSCWVPGSASGRWPPMRTICPTRARPEEGRPRIGADRPAQRGPRRPAERRGALSGWAGWRSNSATRWPPNARRIAARDRGFDPHQTRIRCWRQALLAQNKFDDVLQRMKPDGKDADLDAAILVSRGYAQIGLKQPDDGAESLRRSGAGGAECGGAAAGRSAAVGGARRPRRRPGEDRPRDRRPSRNRPRRCWPRRRCCG